MPFGIFPLFVVGSAFILINKRKRVTQQKALSPGASVGRGTVFDEESLPDKINTNVSNTFSVVLTEYERLNGLTWHLAATPADDSIKFHRKETEDISHPELIGGPTARQYFVFQGAKKGHGSIVFHLQFADQLGQEQPKQIIEIQVEVS